MSHHGEDGPGTRLPEGVPPLRPRGLSRMIRVPRLPGHGPWRHRLNKLFYVAAVVGTGVSLWAYWLTYTDVRDRAASEDEIATVCDGLVDAEAAMDLRGGVVRASVSAGDQDGPPFDARPDTCIVDRMLEPGRSDDLVVVAVRRSETVTPLLVVGDEVGNEPFGSRDDRGRLLDDPTRLADHAEPHPLGDGSLGDRSDNSVTIRAACPSGEPTALEVTATARYDGVSDEDRRILAVLARGTMEEAAARLRCAVRLPHLPARFEAPGRALGAPTSARTSCAWYGRHLGATASGRLPDRMLEPPTAPRSGKETCLLAVSPAAVRGMTPQLPWDSRKYVEGALTYSPWWMRTTSVFGAGTASVGYGDRRQYAYLGPGTAGGEKDHGVWWASSVCDGQPALHTLTVSFTYDDVVLDRLPALFRAYVDDITRRRGCTDVTFPEPSAFTARR
ncbi:hypothetical protein OHA27_14730 [Streptomyces sp. NBC_01619]|uniref:hypothetical protein n=1 Tax=unclassified Streptomyces TaxID=2593676 RepID=UPI0022525E21|nr:MULTISPECIES: hypothetical protein [unclassified Streptomyces]MCX4511543.1 hypothetical protein [Streptomyces sp. NBC_01619]